MNELERYPRGYLPHDFDPGDAEAVEFHVDELARRPLLDPAALEAWVRDVDELFAACLEEGQRRTIAAMQETRSERARDRLYRFLDEMDEPLRGRLFLLEGRLHRSRHRDALDAGRFGEYLAAVRVRDQLHRDESESLFRRARAAEAAHRELCGGVAVFEKDRMSLENLLCFERMDERPRRAEAWRVRWELFGSRARNFDELYDEVVHVHRCIARHAGCVDWTEYLALRLRRSYHVAERRDLHDAIAAHAVPVLADIQRRRCAALGVARLRPWDTRVEPRAPPPRWTLYRDVDEFFRLVRRAVGGLDREFARQLDLLAKRRLLDLAGRPGQRDGTHACVLQESRVPFILTNGARGEHDFFAFVRECGRAFHALRARALEPRFNRTAPAGFARMASEALSLMVLDEVAEFAPAAESRRIRRAQLERVVRRLCHFCLLDAFELELHAGGAWTRDRGSLWRRLFDRFRGDLDYSGLAECEARQWHVDRILYAWPQTAIDEAVALLGALQIWRRFRADRRGAIADYRRALALGGSRSLAQLHAIVGAPLDFSEKEIAGLMEFLADELDTLGG